MGPHAQTVKLSIADILGIGDAIDALAEVMR